MTTPQPRPIRTAAHIRTLKLRLVAQLAELDTCTTAAMRRCVVEGIENTNRQLREAQTAA